MKPFKLFINEAMSLKDEGDTSKLKSGGAVSFNYIRNTQSAALSYGKPQKGDRFKRDIEPAGRYMNVAGKIAIQAASERSEMETGSVTFKNPIVLKNNRQKWKDELSQMYNGLTGIELSRALKADGVDGIITLEDSRRGPYISEVVDLTTI